MKKSTTNNFHDQAFTLTVHKGILLVSFHDTFDIIIFRSRRPKCLKTLGILPDSMALLSRSQPQWAWYLCLPVMNLCMSGSQL